MYKECKIKSIIKRTGELVSFDPEKITLAIYRSAAAVGGHNRELSENLTNQVIEIINVAYSEKMLPTVESIQNIVEKILIENGHAKTAKAYIIYRAQRNEMRKGKDQKEYQHGNIPYDVIWRTLWWNVEHGCETVEKLNKIVKDKDRFCQLVKEAEDHYNYRLTVAAQNIYKHIDTIRMIIISGPSSSGKTTTTHRIEDSLNKHGLELVALNVDNYYFDLEHHPKDEFGDYDFETPEALDLTLISEHLSDLIDGKEIDVPIYNFKTGMREKESTKFRLKDNQILLIDSLYGFYDGMTGHIPEENKFKFYIETLCQLKDINGNFIKWTDHRLLRRMLRDFQFRSYDPERTVGHWHYVRKGEIKHIIPNMKYADFIFDGAMPYELPVMKKHLFQYIKPIMDKYQDQPKQLDAYLRAKRLFELLDPIEAVEDDSCIPSNSVLREFIGGSELKY